MLFLVVSIVGQHRGRKCKYFKTEVDLVQSSSDSNYVLVFEDNFDGVELDQSKWKLISWRQGNLGDTSKNEVATLDRDNLEVSGGTIKIRLRNEPKERRAVNYLADTIVLEDGLSNLRTYKYSYSNIWTKKENFHEGKYEIRAKIDPLQGIWPAFWTYSGNGATAGGQPWSELDIFEIYFDSKYKNHYNFTTNVHFDYDNDGSTSGNQCPSTLKRSDLNEWHTYTCIFSPTKISIYIDDELIVEKYKYKKNRRKPIEPEQDYKGKAWELYGWPRNPGALILNMALQSNNIAPDKSFYDAAMEVDYVRYWKISSNE